MKSHDRKEFFEITGSKKPKVEPCFMTGSSCVYSKDIIDSRKRRRDKGERLGFLALPFRPNVRAFFDICFQPYLSDAYSGDKQANTRKAVDVILADDIRKTGYVVCQRICKQIQSLDFFVADISIPNANVFYELGLAYGSGQNILILYNRDSKFGQRLTEPFQEAGCNPLEYHSLNYSELSGTNISAHFWNREVSDIRIDYVAEKPFICILDKKESDPLPLLKNGTLSETLEDDIPLNFRDYVGATITNIISNFANSLPDINERSDISSVYAIYKEQIQKLEKAERIKNDASFSEIEEKIRQSFCAIIRIEGNINNIMTYFWLGYAHAIGKNVIPITVMDKSTDSKDDIAFDVRSLWHTTFNNENSEPFRWELSEILRQIITSDFTEWSRRHFWREILGSAGEAAIFTGAINVREIGREMIADWDLRAVSSLTSYFAAHQYRAAIESPIYQKKQFLDLASKKNKQADPNGSNNLDDIAFKYIDILKNKLLDKNCIIIAPPDVNPLTEVALGKIYNVPENKWFSDYDVRSDFDYAMVVVKEKFTTNEASEDKLEPHLFFRED